MGVPRIQPEEIDGRYSEVIDVRSPGEFAEDRVPGAINLPVLSDVERAEVGTIYTQVSAFKARRLGAAMITKNIGRHLERHFSEKEPGYRPVVYCWRGGQRSQGMATILSGVGWPVSLLEGGYKAYRKYVRERLDRVAADPGLDFRIVAGLTGAGKTRLLRRMAAEGHQVLDLEKLANHRGSLLGREFPEPEQPTQKQFENRMFEALKRLEPGRPVWVESESNRIGELHVPGVFWGRMREARVVELQVSAEVRAESLLMEYPHFVDCPDRLRETVRKLKSLVGGERVERWEGQVRAGEWKAFVMDILESHYDPAYLRSRERIFQTPERFVEVLGVDGAAVEAAVRALVEGG